ncbi:MAG TPA: tripartite tricarboxylate transporter substrate binding protein [Xanthobacteraceae bacterium]|nr:tripartite tricarboxylate transporter substrate binding protein [Xanthobacteraceae bacterium]
MRRRAFLQLAASAAAIPSRAFAQAYPVRPVRVIVPYAPGGPTDVCARLIAQGLSDRLGKQFYVENVPGAGGNIGTGQAARAAPDGYAILITVNSHVINPTLYRSIPYDPFKDFEPVSLVATFASALSVNPALPAKNVGELVALVRGRPGKYSFASPGFGTPSHLLGEQFRVALGLDLVHVPYGGSGPATTAAIAGDTPIVFAALSAAVPQVAAGKLRALAVMSKNRSQALVDLPTIAEAGFPDLDGDGWIGALVPAGTPAEITQMLRRGIVETLMRADVQQRLRALGFDPVGSTPDEFATQMKREMSKWARVIRAAHLTAE